MDKKMGFYEATVKVLGDTDRKDETETVKAVKREAMELDTGIETLKFRARKIATSFERCAKSLEDGLVANINDPSGHCDTDKFPTLVLLHEQRVASFRTLVRTALGTDTLGKILDLVARD